jgi:hypothetical protein
MPGMTASLRTLVGEHNCMAIVLGQVHVEDGKSTHWELTDEGNIIVSVLLYAGAIPVWAVLSDIGGLRIPVVGTEVLVAHYGGIEGVAVIVGTLPKVTLAIAEEAATKRLIIDDQVWIYDGMGTPVALALKSDVDAVKSWGDAHVHADPATGWTSTPVIASTPTPDPVPTPAGSSIVKGQ